MCTERPFFCGHLRHLRYTAAGATIALRCMGCIWVFGRGRLTSHCRGPVHQAIYMCGYLPAAYFRNIHPVCWLPTLHTLEKTWCGRWRKLWTRRYGRRNNRTVYTHTSKPSQPWTHQRQPTYMKICECGLSICSDCPAVNWPGITIYGCQCVLSRTGYCMCLWDTAQTEPCHPRHGTGLHLAAAQLAPSPHAV